MITTELQPLTELIDGMISSICNVVPVPFDKGEPQTLENHLEIQSGELIGMTGQLKWKAIQEFLSLRR